jgi:hypothetical protein
VGWGVMLVENEGADTSALQWLSGLLAGWGRQVDDSS